MKLSFEEKRAIRDQLTAATWNLRYHTEEMAKAATQKLALETVLELDAKGLLDRNPRKKKV